MSAEPTEGACIDCFTAAENCIQYHIMIDIQLHAAILVMSFCMISYSPRASTLAPDNTGVQIYMHMDTTAFIIVRFRVP